MLFKLFYLRPSNIALKFDTMGSQYISVQVRTLYRAL